ncbi:glycerophosphodiester phosphodiesterase [Geodermatophilus poikilotrophus]|uniref:Glycerophosphoryl diester phosphodiesterase n=1 Tax=Geodermatophilus poikilotrophus TaxID=1333667 RepID=A0A1I0BT76_9ACTN|nr:glycerophosphodiester phosphodiesterase [Geodermatophilus poikilotrophus]SET09840.1 glycerophosphoryl diester phosphodiesterase [Geodermatophilus poikilotrophus]
MTHVGVPRPRDGPTGGHQAALTASPRAAAHVFGAGPAVIGHRGLGCGVVRGHRENTLGSFTAAAALGMTWLEADVRRTADDVLVVAHDQTFPDGVRVSDVSAVEADRRGVLRLHTLLEQLPPDVGLDVDLKSAIDDSLRPPSRTTAALLGPVVAAEAGRRPLLVTSFDPPALGTLRAQAPSLPLGWLTWHHFPLDAAVAACAHMDVDVLGLHVGSLADRGRGTVGPATVAGTLPFVHGAGRRLMVWCPDAHLAGALLEAGADAVVVDGVPTVLELLGPQDARTRVPRTVDVGRSSGDA